MMQVSSPGTHYTHTIPLSRTTLTPSHYHALHSHHPTITLYSHHPTITLHSHHPTITHYTHTIPLSHTTLTPSHYHTLHSHHPTITDPAQPQSEWALTEGWVAEEGKVLLPPKTVGRTNLIDCYHALLLAVFMEARLFEVNETVY